jgi:hypothetical protein
VWQRCKLFWCSDEANPSHFAGDALATCRSHSFGCVGDGAFDLPLGCDCEWVDSPIRRRLWLKRFVRFVSVMVARSTLGPLARATQSTRLGTWPAIRRSKTLCMGHICESTIHSKLRTVATFDAPYVEAAMAMSDPRRQGDIQHLQCSGCGNGGDLDSRLSKPRLT